MTIDEVVSLMEARGIEKEQSYQSIEAAKIRLGCESDEDFIYDMKFVVMIVRGLDYKERTVFVDTLFGRYHATRMLTMISVMA